MYLALSFQWQQQMYSLWKGRIKDEAKSYHLELAGKSINNLQVDNIFKHRVQNRLKILEISY